MSDDLISRSALLEDIDFDREAAKVHPQEICERFNRFCDYAEELVKDASAVDAEPVIRCNICKYYETDTGYCHMHDHGMNWDDFCSRGERVGMELKK